MEPEEIGADIQALTQGLETAHEELRVADEEIRVQQDEIAKLIEGQHLLRWQHERMMAVLPVPVLMTDTLGVIRSANAAAAALLRLRVPRLVGKPILALVATEDRVDIRRLLAQLNRDGGSFRRVVTLRGRDGLSIGAELSVVRLPEPAPQISWMLLVGSVTERPATPAGEGLPWALSRLALVPTAVADDQEALNQAADICQEGLGPDVVVSISLGPPDEPRALASSAHDAQAFDGAQLAAGQGPSLSAYAEAVTVESADVRNDSRWPRLSEFISSDVRGVVCVPLEVGDDLVGTFCAYVRAASWPSRLREEAELLASTIGAVLFELGLKRELQEVAADLEVALTSRATIDQAKGIVMAKRGIDAEAAFEHLARLSSTRHRKLRDIAQEIVDGASGSS